MTRGIRVPEHKCVEALILSKKILGHSPSRPEYRELDMGVSVNAITNKIGDGTWNSAKECVGLETVGSGGQKDIDESYFSNPENCSEAYWMGFVYGDGSIVERGIGSNILSVGIHQRDEEHLNKLKEDTNSDHKISVSGEAVSWSVRNSQIISNLEEVGLDSEKTYSATVPDIKSKCARASFIRGLFDADGHIGQYERFNITGSNKKRFKKLEKWIPVSGTVQERGDGRVVLRVGSKEKLVKLYPWLYPDGKDTEPALSRKKSKIKYID